MPWNETYGPDWNKPTFVTKQTPTGGTAIDWNTIRQNTSNYLFGNKPSALPKQQYSNAATAAASGAATGQTTNPVATPERRDMTAEEMTNQVMKGVKNPMYGAIPMIDMRMTERGLVRGADGVWTAGEDLQKAVNGNYLKNASLNDQVYQRQAQDQERAERQFQMQEAMKKEQQAAADNQRYFDSNIGWALNNPNAPGAAKYLMQLQQGMKIGGLPDSSFDKLQKQEELRLKGVDVESNAGLRLAQGENYGAQANLHLAQADASRAAIPYIGPKAEAETGLLKAQTAFNQGRNQVELGSARAKAVADVLAAKQKQTGKGALDPKNRIDLENMAMTNPEGYARLMKEFGIAG